MWFDPVSDRRRLKIAAIRYMFNIVYVIWTISSYMRLSCIKLMQNIFIYYYIVVVVQSRIIIFVDSQAYDAETRTLEDPPSTERNTQGSKVIYIS